MLVAFCVTLIMCSQNLGFAARIPAYGDVLAAHKKALRFGEVNF